MKPSSIYLEKKNIWRKTNEQLNLMINDTCPNNFTIIKPNKLIKYINKIVFLLNIIYIIKLIFYQFYPLI